jgi:hypothetical protein
MARTPFSATVLSASLPVVSLFLSRARDNTLPNTPHIISFCFGFFSTPRALTRQIFLFYQTSWAPFFFLLFFVCDLSSIYTFET